ncbi:MULTISPECIES: hypothetical protein [unclassified Treponema]|uniref:hypothetical protein n=1 Tax=unclassified Treponema TaxID=2638727 RepID=UPI000E90B52D|nr:MULTISPECIES: hypothetical protein [unclassified Treponema]HBP08754.1 hypothetical protein [Treponema sp.]
MENLKQTKKVSLAGLRKRSLYIALGFMLVFDSIFFALLNIEFLHLNLKELWPVIVINAGLAFIVSDLFIYKKIRTVFLFPSVALFVLGIIFLLFSLHVFHISFAKFISVFWPIVLFVLGILLILVYGVQRINSEEFPYMKDDSSDDNF